MTRERATVGDPPGWRRFVYLGLFVALLPWIVIGIVRESTDDDTKEHYFVRAIFDNASTLVAGEDVKVAGRTGRRDLDLDVTGRQEGGAVTLRIDDEDFTLEGGRELQGRLAGADRREVRGLRAGFDLRGAAAKIEDGPGEGERLLPVENTSCRWTST